MAVVPDGDEEHREDDHREAGDAEAERQERAVRRTAAKLLNLADEEVSMRKGAVWWFRTRVRDSEPRTVLMSVQNPDML